MFFACSFSVNVLIFCFADVVRKRPVGVACPENYFREVNDVLHGPHSAIRWCAYQQFLYVQEHYPHLYFYHWTFHLNKHFTLNLTFDYVYFSSTSINECYFANLTVFDCDKMKPISIEWKGEVQYNVLTSVFNFTFCGIHSKTIICSRCPHVGVVTQLQHFILHDTKLSFSIIDLQRIVSTSISRNLEANTQVMNSIWDVEMGTFASLIACRLAVEKYKTLLVSVFVTTEVSLEVYDRPGPLSPLLGCATKAHSNISTILCKTSSFQCTVFAYYKSNVLIDYIAKHMPGQMIGALETNYSSSQTILYPGKQFCQLFHLCLFNVRADPGFRVNISVANMTHIGRNNSGNCLCAGLSVYDKKKEISTVCQNPVHTLESSAFKNSLYRFRNIFSSNNKALLAIYSYKEYANISLTFVVSSTKCRAIQIDVCDINPAQSFFDFFFTQTASFERHIADDECLTLQLGCNVHSLSREPNQKPIWASAVQYMFSSNPLEKCQLRLRLTNRMLKGGKLRMNVTGFFRGKISKVFFFWNVLLVCCLKRLCSSFSGQFDNFFVHGVPYHFCFQEEHRMRTTFKKDRDLRMSYQGFTVQILTVMVSRDKRMD